MGAVARAAGVSRQALYMHFSSRAGLLVAVVREIDVESGIVARCEEALDDPDPLAAARRFLGLWLRHVPTIEPLAAALLAGRESDEAAAAAWEDRMAELRAGHRRAARRLKDAGLLRDGLSFAAAADLTWALTSVPVWRQLVVDRGWSPARAERHLVDAALRAVAIPD
jgi:AcrR family transcriptional regulator